MQVRNIPVADIVASDLNPRKSFDQQALEELAQSIKENGLIQPITVRKLPKGREAKYEIVCGERRFRAIQLNGIESIDAVVRDLDDKQAFAAMIIENLQRQNVDPMEEAAALSKLFSEGSITVAQMAKMLGKSTSFVYDRIQLNNTIEPFVKLMRDGILVLTHLLDICKLPAEQQQVLYDSCFTDECRARWTYKFPNMPQLHEMIDEHVMNYLSKAKFDPADNSYDFACACVDCPLNTAKNPDSYKDAATPRCMKRECFMRKNMTAVFRAAKESGLPVVFKGQYNENEAILRTAEEHGVEPMNIGGREYVLEPKKPDETKYNDKATYEARLRNYEKVRSAFDDNIADGTVSAVFEIAFNGHLSGERKYVFDAPKAHEEAFEHISHEANNKAIADIKAQLRDCKEKQQAECTEKSRAFLEVSEYSNLNIALSDIERQVFYALVLKRLPTAFKESIGCTAEEMQDYRKLKKVIVRNMDAIAREFIRSILSEKSVNYSADLANMVGAIMNERYAPKLDEINAALDLRFNQYKDNLQSKLEDLRAKNTELHNRPAPSTSAGETSESMEPEEKATETNDSEAEVTEE